MDHEIYIHFISVQICNTLYTSLRGVLSINFVNMMKIFEKFIQFLKEFNGSEIFKNI